MQYISSLFKIFLIVIVVTSLSACANMPWSQKKSDYDFFLENKSGDKIEVPDNVKKANIKGGKEAIARANAAMQQNNLDGALVYYVKALEYNEHNNVALNGIGHIHYLKGNIELAILAFRMVLTNDKDNLDAKQGLGLALIKANKYDEARFILLNALKDNPQRVKIYNGLGVISDLQRYYGEARWFYANALKIDPDNAIVLTNLGYSYYLEHQWDKAEIIYKRVIDKDPEHKQAWLNLALLQARQGEMFDSMSSFERVLNKAQSYNELGYIMMLDRKYTMAQQLFEKAISASPSYFDEAYKNLDRLKELQQKQEMNSNKVSLQ